MLNKKHKDTMTTKPEWFNEFENKQEECWKKQHEFNKKQHEFNKKQQEFNQKVVKFMSDQNKINQRILSLVQSLVKRIDNLVVKNNLKE